MITPFDSAELTTLDSGTILTDTINSRDVLKGIEIENFTPTFFEIVDDNNVVQVSIPPWSMKTSDLPKSQNFTVRTVSGSPVLTTNTVPNSAYRFGYLTYSYNVGLSTQALLTLAVIGSNVTIGGGTVGLAAGSVVSLPDGQAVTLASGTTVGIDSTANNVTIGSGIVTVNNDVTNPVNTQPVNGSPTNSNYVGLVTYYTTILTVNAVVQKLFISTNNSSSNTALNADTAYLVQLMNESGQSALLFTFNVGAIPPMPGGTVTSGPFFEIDLSPGVYVSTVNALVNIVDSGSEPTIVVGVVI